MSDKAPSTGNAQFKVGDVTVTSVIERHTEMPVDFLPTVSDEQLATHRGWLQPWAVSDDGQLRFVIQALCVEADGRRILVDTCVGPRQLPEMYAWVANDGTFIRALDAAGFGRDDVDLVICTHLHFDHVGWNTILEDGEWVPTFRRARYLLPRIELEHWHGASVEHKESSNVFNLQDAVTPLLDAGVVDLVERDHRVSGTMWLIPTPGHSPGHVSVRLSSQGEEALITGDCAHHPVQLTETSWHTAADMDPEVASATRDRIIDEFADTSVLVIGTHFPPPTAGHLVRDEGVVRFRPVRG
jgi:glyoxylase-like metal-dependent hydrolase (beta-lactamase superfamily II)